MAVSQKASEVKYLTAGSINHGYFNDEKLPCGLVLSSYGIDYLVSSVYDEARTRSEIMEDVITLRNTTHEYHKIRLDHLLHHWDAYWRHCIAKGWIASATADDIRDRDVRDLVYMMEGPRGDMNIS